ncbi:MAG: GGDEF domain-containing protein [Pseudomonadota bacterium]
MMSLSDELAELAAGFERTALDLKAGQEKLLAFGRRLERIVQEQSAELTHEKSIRESNVAERTAELTDANIELRNQAIELSAHNREITLLSKMNDFLQTSNTEAEAYSVISETVQQLFPEDSGAVFVLNASRDMLEAATVWGALPPANLIFPPAECWAHRRGQVHLAIGQDGRCAHVTDDGHMYICLPLLAQGEILGILYLVDGRPKTDRSDELRMIEKSRLAKSLADHIGLGIANLKLRESMRNLSVRDPLTGLFNRRYMQETLAQEQHRATRNRTQLAVIMIDIDHFKQFNDKFGHDGGDAILRALGAFLKNHVRRSDVVCRYGGEEFALILSPSTTDGALQRAEKLRAAIGRLKVHHANQDLGAITLSFGVAIFPDNALDTASLIKAADVALYQAKHQGRNRVIASQDVAEPPFGENERGTSERDVPPVATPGPLQ